MLRRSLIGLLVLGCLNLCIESSSAQLINSEVPFQNLNISQGYSSSINWSLRGQNWFANFGGDGPLLPPFGGVPDGGISGGFGFGGGGVSGNLNFNFAQGSSRSNVSTTPSLTTTNGVPGSISSGTVRPFVTGFTPVVGNFAVVSDYSGATEPLRATAEISQQISQQQISSLRQSQATLHNKKLEQYLLRAERAESEGNKRMARANYRGAIALAAEPLRSQLQFRMKQMLARPAANVAEK